MGLLFALPFLLLLPSPPQDPEAFWSKFSPAYALGDTGEMRKVVSTDPLGATAACLDRGDRLGETADPVLEAQVLALAKAWREAFGNPFLEKEYQYLSLLDSRGRVKRRDWITLVRDGHRARERARAGEAGFYAEAEEKLQVSAKGFDDVGDAYHAGHAFELLAGVFDSALRATGYDNRKAAAFYRDALERWDRVECKIDRYLAARKRLDDLLAQGYDPDQEAPPSGEAPGGGGATTKPADEPAAAGSRFKEGSAWISAPLSFGVLAGEEAVDLPGYDADEIVQTWNVVEIQNGVPSKEPLNYFDPPVHVLREKAAKYSLDVDGDGTGDVPAKVVGKEPVEFSRKSGTGEERYALRFTTLSDQATVQRVQVNFAPSDQLARIFYRSIGYRAGELEGQPVRIYDLNCDGKYGGDPLAITTDMIEGETEPRFDGLQIGRGRRAGPASSVVEIGGRLHRIRLDTAEGRPVLKARELAVPTGTLRLEFKGPAPAKPLFLVVRETGEFAGAFFDLAASPKGALVPAGNYEIAWGLVRSGKGVGTQKAEILKGKSGILRLAPGETKTLTLGRPYRFDFQVTKSTIGADTRYRLEGKSVILYGAAGERYERFWDEVPTPEVVWRKAGSKTSGGKGEEMKRGVLEDVNRTKSFAVLWHPLDLEMKSPGPGEWEFHLSQRHKIFGEIASEWK